jgi:GntR family transcriptional regulator
LPTEAELCERFGVSRITIGKALEALAADWLIVKRQGMRTFVAKDQGIGKSVTLVGSLEEMLAPAHDVGNRLLRYTEIAAPTFVVEALELAAGSSVVCFEALFTSGKQPYAVSRQYVPSAIAAPLLKPPVQVPNLQSLETASCTTVKRARQYIKPVAADSACAKLLRLKLRTPVLEIMRTFYSLADKPVATTTACFHPERYRYEVELLARGGGKRT